MSSSSSVAVQNTSQIELTHKDVGDRASAGTIQRPSEPFTPELGTPLNQADQDALQASYITPKLAMRAGLRRVTDLEGSKLLGRTFGNEDNTGIVFPYRWPGEPTEAFRLRRDHPPQKQDSNGQWKDDGKYLSKADQGGIIYLGPDVTRGMLWDVKLPIVITEGEKKCLALHRVAEENQTKEKLKYLALGLPGVYNWLSRNEGVGSGDTTYSAASSRVGGGGVGIGFGFFAGA